MKFSRGDLVLLSPLCGGVAELSSTPAFLSVEDSKVIGYFLGTEIGVVLDVNMHDCSSVMVLTRTAVGWLAGAWVRRIP